MAVFSAQFAHLNRYQPPALVLSGVEDMGGYTVCDLYILNSDPADPDVIVGRTLSARAADSSTEIVMGAASVIAEALLADAVLKVPQELRVPTLVLEDAPRERVAALCSVGHYAKWTKINTGTNVHVLRQGVADLFRGVRQLHIQPI